MSALAFPDGNDESFSAFDDALAFIHNNPSTPAAGNVAPFTAAQMEAIGTALIDGLLAQVLFAVANIQIFGVKPFEGLQTWANELETAASNALATAEGAQGTATDASNTATTAQNWVLALLQDFFGSSTGAALYAEISAPSISNTPASPQPVTNFPNANSIGTVSHNGGGVAWDSTVTYTDPVSGVTSGGSPKITANGQLWAVQGVIFPVQAGQVVDVAAVVQWSGLTINSGTSPIQLQIVPYPGTTATGPQTAGTPVGIQEITSPGASQTTWTSLAGAYTVPTSGVGFVQFQIAVTADALTGSVWWNACTTLVTGGWLPNLEALAGQLNTDAQANAAAFTTFWQSVWTATTNFTSWSTYITELQSAYSTYITTTTGIELAEQATLQQIVQTLFGINTTTGQYTATSIEGPDGSQNLVDTFDALINQLGAALGGDVADAGGLAWLAQLMNDIGINSTSPLWTFVNQSNTTANTVNYQNAKPLTYGMDNTTQSNITFQPQMIPMTLNTSSAPLVTFVRFSQAMVANTVGFVASSSGSPTGFSVNVYKVDFTNSVLDYLGQTTGLQAELSSSPAFILPSAFATNCKLGDTLALAFSPPTGSGSVITLYGQTASGTAVTMPNHPTANQAAFTGTVSGSLGTGNIAFSRLTFTNANVPYVGFESSATPSPVFVPQSNTFTTNSTYTIQSWDVYVDLVIVGGGGGGEGETGAGNGPGGCGASWAATTLTVGTSGPTGIAAGATITITIGTGGAGGPYFTPGNPGTATTFSWHDASGTVQTLTAAGGLAGNAINNLTSWGLSPGNQVWPASGPSSKTYFGGGTNAIGGVGNPPGGGGTGGAAFQFGFAGAIGQAWIVDRQS